MVQVIFIVQGGPQGHGELLNHSLRVASTRHRSNQAINGRECSKKHALSLSEGFVQQGPIREMSFVSREKCFGVNEIRDTLHEIRSQETPLAAFFNIPARTTQAEKRRGTMKQTEAGENSGTASAGRTTMEELKALVRKHQVCWEVFAEQIPISEDGPRQVGFDLVLYGTHPPEEHPDPGCEKCQAIYKDLRKIATWIFPKEERPSRYEIEIFDSALHYAPTRGNRPDVSLTIKIVHRSEFERPLDECEIVCLNEMKAKLSELGAHEKRWTGS